MDDVRRLQRPAVDLVRRLAELSPGVAALVADHVQDNGEVLPTLMLADIARWYAAACQDRDDDPARYAEAGSVARYLAEAFAHAPDELQNTIAVGFVESLIPQDPAAVDFLQQLPGPLRDELRRMIDWRPAEQSGPPPTG